MSERDKVTLKGIYKYPQAEGFVSVSQYMLVYRDGVKHLLLRCSNDTETVLRSARFVLTELGGDGEVLRSRRLSYKDINAEAGEVFTPSLGIPLLDECVDFRVSFLKATSDRYTYRASGKKANAYYTPKRSPREADMLAYKYSVSSFELSGFKAAAGFMALGLVLLVAVLTVIALLR